MKQILSTIFSDVCYTGACFLCILWRKWIQVQMHLLNVKSSSWMYFHGEEKPVLRVVHLSTCTTDFFKCKPTWTTWRWEIKPTKKRSVREVPCFILSSRSLWKQLDKKALRSIFIESPLLFLLHSGICFHAMNFCGILDCQRKYFLQDDGPQSRWRKYSLKEFISGVLELYSTNVTCKLLWGKNGDMLRT